MNTFMRGGFKAYEPGYTRDAYPSHVHRPVIVDSEGRKHEIIYEYRNGEKYVMKEEQVIELGQRPNKGSTFAPWRKPIDHHRDDDHNSPTKAHGGHEKGKVGSPRYNWDNSHNSATKPHGGHEMGKVGSPRYIRDNNHNSPTKHHSGHEMGKVGSPRYNNDQYNPNKNGVYNRGTMYPNPGKCYDSSSEDEDEDESDYECNDGVCPKPGARANHNHAKDYASHDNEPKPNPNFSVPYYNRNPNNNRPQYPQSPPKLSFSDPYYDKNPNNNRQHYPHSPPSYPVPSYDTNYDQPKPKVNFSDPKPKENYLDPYYKKNPNSHHNYSRSPPVADTIPLVTAHPSNGMSSTRPTSSSPPKIKTRADNPGRKFQDYPETIDSSEAKRKYGGVTVPTAQPKYTGTIDCKKAAEIYNGILVRGNNF